MRWVYHVGHTKYIIVKTLQIYNKYHYHSTLPNIYAILQEKNMYPNVKAKCILAFYECSNFKEFKEEKIPSPASWIANNMK